MDLHTPAHTYIYIYMADVTDTDAVMDIYIYIFVYIYIYMYVCVGEWGWGVEGKQVGSMDEESQVRGCYNTTLFVHQPTRKQCRLSPEMNT